MLRHLGQIPIKTFIWLLALPFFIAWIGNSVASFQRFQSALDIPKADPKRRELLKALQKIGSLPHSEKRETLLFIPQSNLLYWSWYGNCKATPFIAPAITGIALLDGMPPANCKATYYGYSSYQERSPNQSILQAANPILICQAAQARGFAKVIVLDSNQNQEIEVQSLDCQN